MMLGIRKRNYDYDINRHTNQWPSYEGFLDLKSWQDIEDPAVRDILIQRSEFDPVYHPSLLKSMKKPWMGMESVRENHSQSWQDWFVLTALNGKTQGYWLELGASDPVYMNNTYLLESQFGWSGISIDKRDGLVAQWNNTRITDLQQIDALTADWAVVLRNSPRQIDYLQVDLADWATLDTLEKLPHDRHRFSVITFEHDIFQADPAIQRNSRAFLDSLGYHLLIANVAVKNYATNTWEAFEDWWIDPIAVDPDTLKSIQDRSTAIKLPHEIFLQL
jgi:hypothetical protein